MLQIEDTPRKEHLNYLYFKALYILERQLLAKNGVKVAAKT